MVRHIQSHLYDSVLLSPTPDPLDDVVNRSDVHKPQTPFPSRTEPSQSLRFFTPRPKFTKSPRSPRLSVFRTLSYQTKLQIDTYK